MGFRLETFDESFVQPLLCFGMWTLRKPKLLVGVEFGLALQVIDQDSIDQFKASITVTLYNFFFYNLFGFLMPGRTQTTDVKDTGDGAIRDVLPLRIILNPYLIS